MKKLLLFLFALLTAQLCRADGVTVNAARRQALAVTGPEAQLELVATARGEQPAYYIFNNKSGQGFVIMAGDDALGQVLGYSDEGCYDPGDVPPALVEWLAGHERQLRLLLSGRRAPVSAPASEDRQTIGPLLTTRWDQGAPYDLETPEYESGRRSPTGCVATAMAQILKYFASGQSTTAIPSYTSKTLDITMPELPATTFDYSLMRDDYAASDTDAGAREVARLMRYCGQAARMDYGRSSGAAAMPSYFADYFGYNPFAYCAERDKYPSWAWDNLIYNQLATGRPVLFTGLTFSTFGYAGHAFICDGYDGQGLYHFNWGWGGRYNGYYKLSECNPYKQNMTSESDWYGLSIDQAAIINLCPAQAPSNIRLTVRELSATPITLERSDSHDYFTFLVKGTSANLTASSFLYDMALGIYDSDDQLLRYFTISDGTVAQTSMAFSYQRLLSWGSDITSGTYTLRFICRFANTEQWLWGYNGDRYLLLTVDGNRLTISPPEARLTVNSVDFAGTPKPHALTTMRVNMTNSGPTLYSNLYLFADGKPAAGAGVHLDPGQTDDVLLYLTPKEAGTLSLALYTDVEEDDDYQVTGPRGDPVWTGQLDVLARRDPQLSLGRLGIYRWRYDDNGDMVIDGTAFRQKIELRNDDTEPFADYLVLNLYKNSGQGSWHAYESSTSAFVSIAPGETREAEFRFDDLQVGASYLTTLNVYYSDGLREVEHSQTPAFRILGEPSGVTAVPSATATPRSVVSLDGRPVLTPRRGNLYIIDGKKLRK